MLNLFVALLSLANDRNHAHSIRLPVVCVVGLESYSLAVTPTQK